jgi:predicted amidohydrolase
MIIALASPRVASTLDEGLANVEKLVSEASARGAAIVCFPEAYLPGLRGQDFEVLPFDATRRETVLRTVAGQEGLLAEEIRIEEATGLLAARYAPERYGEAASD